LRYDTASSKWVNSNSLIIKDTSYADPFGTGTASIVTEGGMIINSQQDVINSTAALFVAGGAFINKTLGCGGEFRASHTELGPFTVSKRDSATNPDYNSIIFADNRPTGGTTHRIFDVDTASDTSGNTIYKRNLGDDTIHVVARGVSARTIGNIVPVELTASGGRTSTKTISATATAVPLHDDILSYYSTKTFAAGQCVVALTDGTNSSVAMFSFSKCGSILTMVLDQEVHSSSAALNVDYDSTGTIDLNLGTATSAIYCVKVLPVMTSDSITEQF